MAIIRTIAEPIKEDWKTCPVMLKLAATYKKRGEAAYKKYMESLKKK